MKREVVVPETERLEDAGGLRFLKVVLPFGLDFPKNSSLYKAFTTQHDVDGAEFG